MKTILSVSFLFLLNFLWATPISAQEKRDAKAGLELAKQVYHRPMGASASSLVTMHLMQKGHSPRVRTFYSYNLEKKNEYRWSLIRFTEPVDTKDTGLLTLNSHMKDSIQWIFLPAVKKSTRISSSRKGGRFVNSDFYYEDLDDREVEKDKHYYLGMANYKGVQVKKLLSIPVDKANSVYTQRISLVHPESLIPLEVSFYENKKISKVLTVNKVESIQGYWTPMETEMQDKKSGHKTLLMVKKIKYDTNLPKNLFSQKSLEDPLSEQAYRQF